MKGQLAELLGHIRKEAAGLNSVLWSQEELMETQYKVSRFHQIIKAMMNQIPINLYWYQQFGWKKFVPNPEKIAEQEKKEAIHEETRRLKEWMEVDLSLFGFYLSFKKLVNQETIMQKLGACGFRDLKRTHVLDVGCGDGWWLSKFLDWGAMPERLTGTEFSKSILDLARNSSPPGMNWLETYPNELPVGDNRFDIIVSFGMLMHILDEFMLRQTGREMLRVLSDDGIIIAANLHKDAEKQLEPFLSYTTKGLGLTELMETFPDCQIEFEELPQYGMAVIRKQKTKRKEIRSNGT
ncbi:class I SAM-dependent methyltransferase [Ferviditalea candida]|uniref:Methyltransferase domain-containing protein n=1 Tax=Ferviditalea candida TaxID=3108399 RepID=A0ABU5ZI98_9BACL|nr:methyltransferase domain-containing protein [Paenibacillaceae bacterium T2]